MSDNSSDTQTKYLFYLLIKSDFYKLMIYEGCPKSSKLHPERRAMAEDFCCSKTLQIKLEKYELVWFDCLMAYQPL